MILAGLSEGEVSPAQPAPVLTLQSGQDIVGLHHEPGPVSILLFAGAQRDLRETGVSVPINLAPVQEQLAYRPLSQVNSKRNAPLGSKTL